MEQISEQKYPRLCRKYTAESFFSLVDDCGVYYDQSSLAGAVGMSLLPQGQSNDYYHVGHLLILFMLREEGTIVYYPWESADESLCDLLMRRSYLSDRTWQSLLEELRRVVRFFDNMSAGKDYAEVVGDIAHCISMIDYVLDRKDSMGSIEIILKSNKEKEQLYTKGIFKLISVFLGIQEELSLFSKNNDLSAEQADLSFAAYKEREPEIFEAMNGSSSVYLAPPSMTLSFDERMLFVKTRDILFESGKYDELIAYYEENEHLFDSGSRHYSRYFVSLAALYANKMQDYDKAVALTEQAFSYEAASESAMLLVEEITEKTQNYQFLADIYSSQAAQAAETKSQCLYYLKIAKVYAWHLGDEDSAVHYFQEALSLNYRYVTCLEQMIAILNSKNVGASCRSKALALLAAYAENEAHIRFLERLMAVTKSDEPEVRAGRLLFEAACERFADNDKCFEKIPAALSDMPQNGFVFDVLKKLIRTDEDVENIREIFDNYEVENPTERMSAFQRLAEIFVDMGRKEAALHFYKRLAECNPAYIPVLRKGAEYSKKIGDKKYFIFFGTLMTTASEKGNEKSAVEQEIEDVRMDNDTNPLIPLEADVELLPLLHGKIAILDRIVSALSTLEDEKDLLFVLPKVENAILAAGLREELSHILEITMERVNDSSYIIAALERHLAYLMSQNTEDARDAFISTHAKLFSLNPSKSSMMLLKSFKVKANELLTWTNHVEDHAAIMRDDAVKVRLLRALVTVCHEDLNLPMRAAYLCQQILSIDESAADILSKAADIFIAEKSLSDCMDLFSLPAAMSLPGKDRNDILKRCLSAEHNDYEDYTLVTALLSSVASDSDFREILDFVGQAALKDLKMSREKFENLLSYAEDSFSQVKFALVRFERIDNCRDMGDIDRAKELFEDELLKECVEAHPETESAYAALGVKLFPDEKEVAEDKTTKEDTAEKQDSAADLLNRVYENGPSEALMTDIESFVRIQTSPQVLGAFLLNLADALERHDALEDAEKQLKRALTLDSDNELYFWQIIEFYLRHGAYKRSLVLLNFKLSKPTNRERREYWDKMLFCHEETRDFASAADTVSRMIEQFGESPELAEKKLRYLEKI